MQRLSHLVTALLILGALSGVAVQKPVTSIHPHLAGAHSALAASPRLQREVFGFALASSLSDPSIGWPSWNFNLLSTVAFFGLHVNDDGTFTGDSDWATWNDTQQRTAFVNAAHGAGTKVVLTIIEQDFSPGTPHMCSALQHASATVGFAAGQVRAQGVDGLNVDYEGLNGSCGTNDPSWARHAMSNFAASLRSALPAGSYLSIDTYASAATDSLGFFDIGAMAPSVDSFFVMAYDLEYSNYNHPPLNCPSFCLSPTAPLTGYYYNDTSTASQYTSVVAPSKVILGVPYYGRKACVSSASPNQAPNPTSSVGADGYLDASTESSYYTVLAGSYTAHRDANDAAGEERWDTWWNTQLSCTREMYWDDATSLGQKYNLVNQDNLRGVGIWTLNYGGGASELWNQLASHFSLVPLAPKNVSACPAQGAVTVSWTAATTQGTPITGYQVTASPGGATVTTSATATVAEVTGLTPGTPYTVTVQAVNSAGAGVGVSSASVTPVSNAPIATSLFSWFDNATYGMAGDNIHLLNSDATTGSSGCVMVAGKAVVPFSLRAGEEQHVTFPPMTIGGLVAVIVDSGPAVQATQRVQFFQSFNEIWAAGTAQAATTSYINWFDKATQGMVGDNIHVMNAGSMTANVKVTLGSSAVSLQVPAGGEGFTTFPSGTIGGPVVITSDQPVLASQRVQYYQSFNEVWASSAAQAATTAFFNWYDRTTVGMAGDNIHVLNPGAAPANVSVTLAGRSPIGFTLGAGQEHIVEVPAGTIGGPVTVTSTQPVLASQRVQYYQSFNEVASETAAQALQTIRVMWFDKVTNGMLGDNIHVFNSSSSQASVSVAVPGGGTQTLVLAPGTEGHVTFAAGVIGGPVTITANVPVLAAQRVQYFQSFNEVPAR